MKAKSSAEKSPHSAKREQLLDTAWSLFCRNGYRAVGIDTVLAEAGVAKMTLYKHFASKEDLIASAMEKNSSLVLASLEQVIEAAGPDPDQRLMAVFDWLAGWFSQKDFSGCAFLKAVGEYNGEDDKPRQAGAAFKQAMQERLEQLCVDANLKSPSQLARQLLLLMDGATLHADMYHRADYASDARAAAQALIAAAR
ncbi:TetR/AcrR family transcriptional regulator [Luteolibacter pohnpeiensis]|uniref:TetR/AcrR family transcriptional regulator n=1 Tax=Luteolibacter pohnpeiensis TaxID=454153 RepID=A0A934SE72_9BACT|nr:TetR/AcrR family transcriptional regulator [Luteolibacter pohnpeiensis]MBK1883578.1 TetR/AcrR family transcriptional regulator [Luteolibacter pohnpeiensis]